MDKDEIYNKTEIINEIINNIMVAIIGIPFIILPGLFGINGVLNNNYDSTIIGTISILVTIIALYKESKLIKEIIEQINIIKEGRRIPISIGNIGHIFISLIPFTFLFLFYKLFTNSEGEFFELFFFMAVGESIVGSIIIFIDGLLVGFKKNNVIIDIKLDDKIEE